MTPEIAQTRESPRAARSEQRRLDPVYVSARADVYESASELLVVVDLPGVEASAIDVEIEGSELRVEAPRNYGPDRAPRHYVRRFSLAETVDKQNVAAAYEAGVLSLRLNKTAASKPRQIPVN
jgi:HSP20 family protein